MSDTTRAGDGASVMDATTFTKADGTVVKRDRVVLGDDTGTTFSTAVPMPTDDRSARLLAERAQLAALSKLDVNLSTRFHERLRHGDRLDLIDFRGPGGR